MKIGVPKEIKNNENRVGLTPANVLEYTKHNHQVFVEQNAGIGSGFSDEMYESAGAIIVGTAKEAWNKEMVIKVKEPLETEYEYFYEGLIVYTYLHLAAEPKLTAALVNKKVSAFAYETIIVNNQTPLLRPMSEVAGRRSITIGANLLEGINGGKGMLLGGTPGVEPAHVMIVGGGIAGFNAAQMAVGLGAHVTILELDEDRIRELNNYFKNDVQVLKSNHHNLMETIKTTDLLVSTILIPGAKAPKIITKEMVKTMHPGGVIVDIAIDQGGSVETVDRITTHDNPTFEKYGVIHYSVANMPGAVAKTATQALTNATLKYGLLIAEKGVEAINSTPELKEGLNVHNGEITNKRVRESLITE